MSNLNIIKVNQNRMSIEIMFNKDISNKIDGENLFISAINITRNFRFKYKNESLIISLSFEGLNKHYIYYLTDLLNRLKLKET